MTSADIRIGISSRLLGEQVRFDGGHKRDPFLVDTSGQRVEWVPVLCGYAFKKDSPSCGRERVKVYDRRLSDPRLRENFVERVFASRRLRSFFAARWTVGGLVRFHTAHKLLLMAHSAEAWQRLGRVAARAKTADRVALRERYAREVMDALNVPATRRRHVNVLQHALGHFRDRLDEASRLELLGCIEEYRAGLVPLVVPITLVRHHVRALGADDLAGQVYLQPSTKELMLRNHV